MAYASLAALFNGKNLLGPLPGFPRATGVLHLSRFACAMQGALTPSDSAQGRRRLLKDRYVREEANYGRVNYGIRVATVNRLDLVNGLISPK